MKAKPAEPTKPSVGNVKSLSCKIYVLVDPRDGDIRYVGKTELLLLEQRLKVHLQTATHPKTRNTYRARWIRRSIEAPIIRLVQNVPAAEWQAAEQYWISFFKGLGCRLTNATVGGEGISDSPEIREKRKASLAKRWTKNWHSRHALLLTFVSKHGHANVPADYVTLSGCPLGTWVARQRKQRLGLSKKQRRLLQKLTGWNWAPRASQWSKMYTLLEEYVRANGDASVPVAYRTACDAPLGIWVQLQRAAYNKGTLGPERLALCVALEGWTWHPLISAWESHFAKVQALVASEGHALIPSNCALGRWASKQRQAKLSGKLSTARQRRLESLLGWVWEVPDAQWEGNYNQLVKFHKVHGHFQVTPATKLFHWVNNQRQFQKNGKLSKDRADQLQALKGWNWDPLEEAWANGLEHVRQYVAKHKHALIPALYKSEDGYTVGQWVRTQRFVYKCGKLAADRLTKLNKIKGWVWTAKSGPARRSSGCRS